jgi:stress response protein YsnF
MGDPTSPEQLDNRDPIEETLKSAPRTSEKVIPVVEETVAVHKRGGASAPCDGQERVEVERRPADRGLHSVEDAFQERTIEMEEHREEPVVSKEARVKEELVVKRDVEQRTETVSDTVRSTEVEVEDERGNTISKTGTKNRT